MSDGYIFHTLECKVCGRKVLVERFMIGVSHTTSINVTCADCIGAVHPNFVKENPEAAKEIEEWSNEGGA